MPRIDINRLLNGRCGTFGQGCALPSHRPATTRSSRVHVMCQLSPSPPKRATVSSRRRTCLILTAAASSAEEYPQAAKQIIRANVWPELRIKVFAPPVYTYVVISMPTPAVYESIGVSYR